MYPWIRDMLPLYFGRSAQGEAITAKCEVKPMVQELSTSIEMLKKELAYWNKRNRAKHNGSCRDPTYGKNFPYKHAQGWTARQGGIQFSLISFVFFQMLVK